MQQHLAKVLNLKYYTCINFEFVFRGSASPRSLLQILERSREARIAGQLRVAVIRDAANKSPEERKAAAAKAKADSEAVKCAICKQGFMCTAKVKQLMIHVESKHAKEDPLKCFPCIPAMQAAEDALAAGGGAAEAKPVKKKKPAKKESLGDLLAAGGVEVKKKGKK